MARRVLLSICKKAVWPPFAAFVEFVTLVCEFWSFFGLSLRSPGPRGCSIASLHGHLAKYSPPPSLIRQPCETSRTCRMVSILDRLPSCLIVQALTQYDVNGKRCRIDISSSPPVCTDIKSTVDGAFTLSKRVLIPTAGRVTSGHIAGV